MWKIILILFLLASQLLANEKDNYPANYNTWDADFIKELENKKFNTYIQLIRTDFEKLNVDKEKFNPYVIELNDAMECYSKTLKATFNSPSDFRIRYYSKDSKLLNDLFLMGRLCIKKTVNGYDPNPGWTAKDKQEFRIPVQQDAATLLTNNYDGIDASELVPLSNKIADCFINQIEKDFPNHITLIEHYFNGMDRKIDNDIIKYISNTKNQCIDSVLDNYENSFKDYKSISERIRIISSKYIYYPPAALRLRQEGVVEVQFFLYKNGSVSNLSLNKSSGFDLLDMTALDIVKTASKDFPKPSKTLRINVPITFKIK